MNYLNGVLRRRIQLALLSVALFFSAMPWVRAGLGFELHLYRNQYGYAFYTPLTTNNTGAAAAFGTYAIYSPSWPTNGSYRKMTVDASGVNTVDGGEYGYNDFNSVVQQITNGTWSIIFTNATTTNTYTFTVSASGVNSNQLPATTISFPADGTRILATQTNFTWRGPTNWVVIGFQQLYGDSIYQSANLPASQTSWAVPGPFPLGPNYTFNVQYMTNTASFPATTPLSTNVGHAPISGWVSTSVLESGATASFEVFSPGAPSTGHTLQAYYTFEDNNLFVHDFSGHGYDMSYAWFGVPPTIVTNDAAYGTYAGGLGGSGWFTEPTNVLDVLARSFTVSMWVKPSGTHGNDTDDQYNAAGIYSGLSGDYSTAVMPMGYTGSKLAFYTGGTNSQNILHSQASINTGQYVHVVTTRDQQTGEKRIYINGTLDSAVYAQSDVLTGGTDLAVGYNNGQVFLGKVDEIQVYSGVLSSNEVAYLHNNPGLTVSNVASSDNAGILAHYDFDEGSPVAPDVSGNGNDMIVGGDFGGAGPSIDPTAIAGAGSVYFDGGSYLTASTNLLPALAGTFSISLWIKTTDDSGSQGDPAWAGAGVIAADVPNGGGAGDIIPVALTGGQVAFNTGNTTYNYDDTINSSALVNDGQWHHIVVMRDQPTGEKDIYIDNVLDTSDFDTTNLLTDPKILTIGCKADASNSDPSSPSYTGANGFTGLLDDIQVYDRVLTTNEVAFLFANPGATLSSPVTNAPYPVDVDLKLDLVRSQDPNYGDIFLLYPSFNSISPTATTTNRVQSPSGYYRTETSPSSGSSSSAILNSLGQVLNECTNGFWTLYINEGSPTQQVYSFQVSINGLTTNVLPVVKVFLPTNGAVNISTNPAYYWVGPSNYATLTVDLLSGPAASLPVAATNWPGAPTLSYGTNRFDVSYVSNGFPGFTFSTPVDPSSNPIDNWSTTVNLSDQSFNNFVIGAPAPLPVTLKNVTRTGSNLSFSFQTLAGRPHTIQGRTNLTLGVWIDLTNFVGDGSLRQFSFTATNPPIRFFRVNTH